MLMNKIQIKLLFGNNPALIEEIHIFTFWAGFGIAMLVRMLYDSIFYLW